MTLGIRRRHTRLHDALIDLEETHKVQAVEVPEDRKPLYYQKYALTLAERWGIPVKTGLKFGHGAAVLILRWKAAA